MDIIFTVEDTGIGIPTNELEFIFDAFRQTENQDNVRYGGTGLGLSITKHLTERLGGKISVRSKVGKGSIFRVEFKDVPVRLGPAVTTAKKDSEPDTDAVIFKNAMILVVDDLASNRTVLKGYLDIPGLTVMEAENGQNALEHIKQYLPDLVIMEMRMPVLIGVETTRRLKADKRSAHIPVIALTASVMDAEQKIALESGSHGFLKKPLEKRELILELMKFLPYEIIEEPVTPLKTPEEPIPEATRNLLPELLEELEHRFIQRWHTISNKFIIDEIETFSRELGHLGNRYRIKTL